MILLCIRSDEGKEDSFDVRGSALCFLNDKDLWPKGL